MQKYEVIRTLGTGAYGSVYLAKVKGSEELVAIKSMNQKYKSWRACVQLKELKALKALKKYSENIVAAKELVLEKQKLHFIFEYMEADLYKIMKKKRAENNGNIPVRVVQSWIKQILNGVHCMHCNGFFHRDIKPENILYNKGRLKLADFGLAREIRSRPPFTPYVSTRWYRSPELLLRTPSYNSPVDIWACGTMLAEFFLPGPLWPGTSEVDQISRIFNTIGYPKDSWQEGQRLAKQKVTLFTRDNRLICPQPALLLMKKMLILNPLKRISTTQALQEHFITSTSTSDDIELFNDNCLSDEIVHSDEFSDSNNANITTSNKYDNVATCDVDENNLSGILNDLFSEYDDEEELTGNSDVEEKSIQDDENDDINDDSWDNLLNKVETNCEEKQFSNNVQPSDNNNSNLQYHESHQYSHSSPKSPKSPKFSKSQEKQKTQKTKRKEEYTHDDIIEGLIREYFMRHKLRSCLKTFDLARPKTNHFFFLKYFSKIHSIDSARSLLRTLKLVGLYKKEKKRREGLEIKNPVTALDTVVAFIKTLSGGKSNK